MPDLLLELFSEEIPARMQARAAEDLKKLVTGHMVENGLTYAGAAAFATPRRLVLAAEGLDTMTRPSREERKGPRTDAPDKAIEGFLRSTGLSRDDLEIRDDKKGQVFFAVIEKPGRPASEIVTEAVEHAIRNFPWPKSMRWGAGSLRWVRPLHSILCILSDEAGATTVELEIEGVRAGSFTSGHRFMGPSAFAVTGFEDYREKLYAAHVILDPVERAETIWAEATNLAFAQGLEVVEDRGLLAEVAGLVEWPVVLMGEIGEAFLDLPPEVLQTSMKEHQKFFSVKNPKTGRIERFITVANISAPDGGAAILAGNQRVLSARLADAKFFWENDLRAIRDGGLEAMAAPLENVVFHQKLGSQAERIERIAALAREIAPSVGADPDLAEQAAKAAKADLASEMVYEFPELQGTMGKYYARAAGLSDAVAEACETHYAPLGPSDDVPTEPVAIAVALADKIDMLTGFWAIDEKPTGSKDPFALRRAALGVIRTLLEAELRLNLWKIVPAHLEKVLEEPGMGLAFLFDGVPLAEIERHIDPKNPNLNSRNVILSYWLERLELGSLLSFLADRLKVHLREQGIRHDVIQACFDLGGQDDLVLLVNRVRALQDFLETQDGANLLAGYKRASNILAAEEKKDGEPAVDAPDAALTTETEENALFTALDQAEPEIAAALEGEDFGAAMTAMAGLRGPVDAFFEAVLVNHEDTAIRANRLRLLNRIRATMRQVAVWEAIEG